MSLRRQNRKFGKRSTALQVVEGLDLAGKTFFITGANAGIGFEAARAIAAQNGHVVMGCRNRVRAMEARSDILEKYPKAKIDVIQLDNADLQSVKDGANKFISKGWPLHCLILNAGVYNPLHRITDDEFETTFQINHLAHFYLTQLLMPLLIASAPSRVVVVSSDVHRSLPMLHFQPQDITWERVSPTHTHKLNSAMTAYGISKFCNVLFAKSLHKRLASKGVTACSLHPGIIRTNIQNNSKVLRGFMIFVKPWMKSVEQGAATTVYCSVASELTPENAGGMYFDDCQAKAPTRSAQNPESAERLWQLSELMLDSYLKRRERALGVGEQPESEHVEVVKQVSGNATHATHTSTTTHITHVTTVQVDGQ